jgi:polar amino acid transport system permease protein
MDRDPVRLAEGVMELIAQQFFNLEIMQKVWPLLLRGLGTSLPVRARYPVGIGRRPRCGARLAVETACAGMGGGRAGRSLPRRPPLVLLILLYSGLPFAGINLSPTVAVSLAFFLNTSSYYGEIYRAGIDSVARGQWEAARSTGLGAMATIVYVVLPQAVRNVLPDLVSNTIEVVKLTSIASVVSFPELLYSADMARSLTFNSSPVVLAAVIYLIVLWPLVRLVGRLERRVAAH